MCDHDLRAAEAGRAQLGQLGAGLLLCRLTICVWSRARSCSSFWIWASHLASWPARSSCRPCAESAGQLCSLVVVMVVLLLLSLQDKECYSSGDCAASLYRIKASRTATQASHKPAETVQVQPVGATCSVALDTILFGFSSGFIAGNNNTCAASVPYCYGTRWWRSLHSH